MARTIFAHVKDKQNPFTVGGMRSKLGAIRMSVTSGVPVFLADGRDREVLTRIFQGEDIGTLFVPDLKKGLTRQDWIEHFLKHVKKPVQK